ncbi:unnamed protein product [Chrysoparadoxa australica]
MVKQNLDITKLPNLIEVQRASFYWFISNGLEEELVKFSSIFDLTGNLELKVYGHEYSLKKPSLSLQKTKERNTTYSLRLYVPIKVIKLEDSTNSSNLSYTEILPKQKVFIGEIPLMTDKGTFITNGCERVIVNQLVRSPGIYFKKIKKKRNNQIYTVYSGTIITIRGSWLTFELNNGLIWIRIDKKYKIPINWFLAALDLTNDEIYIDLKNSEELKKIIKSIKSELLKKQKTQNKTKTQIISNSKKLSSQNSDILAILKVRELICSRILNPKYYDLGKVGRLKLNEKLGTNLDLSVRILTAQDILKIIDYLIDFGSSDSAADDIDSLENRRVRCVGELLQLQVRVGLNRLERSISEKLTICDIQSLRASTLVNPKPLVAAMKEFFGSSQLSQFMDETNPLSELTHKRRISALGPGGLSTQHVTFAARDIHPTQYGRLCPIETPEGQNAGLISSLACHAKLDEYGFIETPFFRVKKGKILKEEAPIYLTANKENNYKIAPADIKINENNQIEGELVPVRYNHEFTLTKVSEVDLITISPIQIISAAAALIPFLEHDDANRALMGSNMQRQAVPLLYPQPPIVGTGLESQIVADSGTVLTTYYNGIVDFVNSKKIVINNNDGAEKYKIYLLEKYRRSNQDTCINQTPIVWKGQIVNSGQILTTGSGTECGELALGQNLTVAYMPWEGYNFEDAILVSERLVYDELFTSIHIEKYEVEIRQTKTGPEQMTANIPNVSESSLTHLDPNTGLVCKGALVEPGDVLVGKVTPKGESDQLPEGKLLKAIFGEKTPDVRDTSLRVPNGISGRIIDVIMFSKQKGDDVPPGALNLIQVFIAQVRKIRIGDKIAGRHGNKGIISQILPIQDMPYLPDGTIVDIILNPLGVPSRMNVGQIFECLLGLAGDNLNKRFKILPFDEMYGTEASRVLINTKLKEAAEKTQKDWLFNKYSPGKILLTDARTGETFDNPVLVGKSYILKLIHLVDDKIHARSTGPYSLVTQQPVGGKSQQGGQRFGEMEVWALEAFGCAYTLQELLTIKSDDMEGRNEVLNAIVKGQPIPKPGVPESFKVLMRELQALGLDITTYKIKKTLIGQTKGVEIDLMSTFIT